MNAQGRSGTSVVEETLRAQRDVWKEVSERVVGLSRELPPETPKRILLFGVGSSHYAARLAACTLVRYKGRARIPVVSCSSVEIGNTIFPAREDWCFGFSHRGKTRATVRALEACAAAGAYTILVSGQGAETPDSARFLLTSSPMEKVEPHTMSVTGAVCAVTSLLLGAQIAEEWDALRGLGDPNLDRIRDRAGLGPSIIIGEWEGQWLAREGALKLIEMARIPVRAYSSEEFFHGPRYGVSKDDRIWHIALPKDQRNDEINPSLRVHVPTGSALAWVPALVELQWLSLGVALNLGIDPDSAGRE